MDTCGVHWDVPSGTLVIQRYLRDVQRLSWDILHGILWTPCQTSLQRCPLWDPPNSKSHHYLGMSQDSPWMSFGGILRTPSDHSLDIPLCPDCPGHPIICPDSWGTCRTFVGNTGHPSLRWNSVCCHLCARPYLAVLGIDSLHVNYSLHACACKQSHNNDSVTVFVAGNHLHRLQVHWEETWTSEQHTSCVFV